MRPDDKGEYNTKRSDSPVHVPTDCRCDGVGQYGSLNRGSLNRVSLKSGCIDSKDSMASIKH